MASMEVTNRPSPRQVSTALAPSPYLKAIGSGSGSTTTKLLALLGQYVTEEITRAIPIPDPRDTTSATAALAQTILAASNNSSTADNITSVTEAAYAAAPISIPAGDQFMVNYTGRPGEAPDASSVGSRTALKFTRSLFQVDSQGVRAPINTVTACVDASALYGSTEAEASRLRAGTGGLMKDDGQRGLPLNMPTLLQGQQPLKLVNVTNEAMAAPDACMRAAGTAVVNQNPGLLVMATLWLREHNRLATLAASQQPGASDEDLFQHARKWVSAQLSHIIFDEYLPQLVGRLLPPYSGHNSSVNPAIDVFFSTAAYRYGHAAVTDIIYRFDEDWNEHPQGHLLLSQTFFQPDKVLSAGIEPLLRGFITSPLGKVEPRFASGIQHQLFGPANTNGSDLLAINIQRGRDHGLPDYNTCRRFFGLPAAKAFTDISTDSVVASTLQSLYRNNLSLVDAYVGGLAESPVPNGHVGPLFAASIIDQFRRLRDGDWWHYRNTNNGLFTPEQVAEIDKIGKSI
eukprot:gene10237-10396_t